MDKADDRKKLDKINYSIRRAQTIFQYGAGSMVDFRDQVLMTAAPEAWDNTVEVHDSRLAHALKVDELRMLNETVSYIRFPEWYYCPKCNSLKPVKEWVKYYQGNAAMFNDNDKYMTGRLRCAKCKVMLTPSRYVVICSDGHIDDFPWIEWVHKKSYKGSVSVCSKPALSFSTYANVTGLAGVRIKCECGAEASMHSAFNPKVFDELGYKCTGRHPWKRKRESCTCTPVTAQRGATSVYYPVTVKSLVIPPHSEALVQSVHESKNYKTMMDAMRGDIEYEKDISKHKDIIISALDKYVPRIADDIKGDAVEIRKILEREILRPDDDIKPDSVEYKKEEYEALTGKVILPNNQNGDFQREETNIQLYNLPFVKQIALITRIREVRAQVGFTRVNPAERSEEGVDVAEASKIVNIKDYNTNWYPAHQVYGEGIFIEFDQEKLDAWVANNPAIQKRANLLNERYRGTFGAEVKRTITPRFIMLHTLSHLLIKQLGYECGYNIASLSERIYCSEKAGNMAGILIYTSDGDSEGTLGGLVRQGRPDTFPYIFKRALESSISCSNDPVCSLSEGQGQDSLNLSACYSCTLIPETSCEEFNKLLDRAHLVGTFDNSEIGIYSPYLFGGKEWLCTVDERNESLRNNTSTIPDIKEIESDFWDDRADSYDDVWDYLDMLANAVEKNIIAEIRKRKFNGLELPYKEVEFENEYSATLAWKGSKILLFTSAYDDDYIQLLNKGYKCFRVSDLGETNSLNNFVNELSK